MKKLSFSWLFVPGIAYSQPACAQTGIADSSVQETVQNDYHLAEQYEDGNDF